MAVEFNFKILFLMFVWAAKVQQLLWPGFLKRRNFRHLVRIGQARSLANYKAQVGMQPEQWSTPPCTQLHKSLLLCKRSLPLYTESTANKDLHCAILLGALFSFTRPHKFYRLLSGGGHGGHPSGGSCQKERESRPLYDQS